MQSVGATVLEISRFEGYTVLVMKKIFFTCGLCIVCCCLASCAKKNGKDLTSGYSRILNSRSAYADMTHRWFYFTDEGFKETDVPRNAPKRQKKPWTEAVRITSSALINGTGYFLVNKLGMLVCPSASGLQKQGIASKTQLVKDPDLFLSAAAGSLFCIDERPVFNLYTNSIFSAGNPQQKNDQNEAFLIEYSAENRNFIPLLNGGDFDRPRGAQLRELFFINDIWYALFKAAQTDRTEFYAYSFYTVEPITAFARAPISAESGTSGFKPDIIVKNIGVQEFRDTVKPQPSSAMSAGLKDLLAPVPASVPWYLEVFSDGASASERFVRREHAPKARQAYASSGADFSAAVFEDGTVCFIGTLPMKHVVNEGRPVAFKLPRLPAGYTYSCALIAGSTLFVSWEETAFFETGRSGFLAVDLERILYRQEDAE